MAHRVRQNKKNKKYKNDVVFYIEETSSFVRKGKNVLNMLAPTFIVFISSIIAIIITMALYYFWHIYKNDISNTMSFTGKFNIVVLILGSILSLGALYKFGDCVFPKFRSAIFKTVNNTKLTVIICVTGMLFSFFIQNIYVILNYSPSISPLLLKDTTMGTDDIIETIFIIFLSAIICPIYEEIMRHLTIFGMKKLTDKVFIINIVQAILFGLLHLNIVSIILAFLAGLLLGYVQIKYNSVKIAIVAHMVFNLTAYIPTIPILGINISIVIIGALLICLSFYMIKKEKFSLSVNE